MKERPILMNGEMVRATLNGIKRQTRRIVKQDLQRLGDGDWYAFDHRGINYRVNSRNTTVSAWANLLQFCPYGQPGDRLWVREAWRIGAWNEADETVAIDYMADGYARREWLDVPLDERDMFTRLWTQSTDDAIKAGLKTDSNGKYHWKAGQSPCRIRPSIHMPRWASRIMLEITGVRVELLQDISVSDAIAEGYDGSNTQPVDPAIKWYAELWESINGPGSWDANPWVWVIEFKRVMPT